MTTINTRDDAVAKTSRKPELQQVAALPWRRSADGRLSILLITTRETGRWIVPRGWPIRGLSLSASAAMEAFEEAGVSGTVGSEAIGSYTYAKRFPKRVDTVHVDVFDLLVDTELETWPERGQREQRWLAADEAMALVDEAGLKAVMAAFVETVGDQTP